jgi:hypothetical protein
MTMRRCLCVCANLQWRVFAAGFALPVTPDKSTVWESAGLFVPLFSAVGTEVRAAGTLSPGNITAWHSGRSPR